MGAPRRADWNKILGSLLLFTECPPNYLTITEFGILAGASTPLIIKAIRVGKIARKHCAALMKKASRKMVIDWNAAGYGFILQRAEKWWPEDFAPNDECFYLPIETDDTAADKLVDDMPDKEEGFGYQLVTDIASAKYRVEQLKIAKMQAEIKLANNEVVPLEKVMAHERELALEIKASIRKAENKMAPLLAQANTVLECRAILEAYHREAFEALRPLESNDAEAKEISSD